MENANICAVFYLMAHVCVPQGNVPCTIHEITHAVMHDSLVSLAWVGNIKLKCKDCREEYMRFNFNMEESKGTGYVS